MVAAGHGLYCKEAEVTEVKPSQNLPLHRKSALKPYKIRQQLAKSVGNYDNSMQSNKLHVFPAAKTCSGDLNADLNREALSEFNTDALGRNLITMLWLNSPRSVFALH